jgi:membrane protease YdiL (CAAX protease family)
MTAASIRQTRTITLWILAVQAGVLCILFFPAPEKVPTYLGFTSGQSGGVFAWVLAALTVILYVSSAASIQAVRDYMFRADSLKLIAVLAALCAGIVEEVVFRRLLMDFLANRGYGALLQIVASAVGFGLAHAIWGVKSWRAAVNAILSTTLLGGALAVVYLVAERSLAPCVVAHILISALIEPGLMHAAVQDKIGVWRAQ